MIDIQKKLAIKNIYDLVHKEIKGKKMIQEMNKFKSMKGNDQKQLMVKNLCIIVKVL